MEIVLQLNRHCIETEAKRTYERLLRTYFGCSDGQARSALEVRIDALKRFLETADFGFLRSHYPALNGKENVRVHLVPPENRPGMILRFNGKTVGIDC